MITHKIFYNKDVKAALVKSIDMNLPALLIGETGTGKTSFVYDLAKQHNKAKQVIRVNLTGQTGVDELIGKYLANKQGTYWVDGLLIHAMRKGYWIVLDEINMALPEILSKLHSLLDDDRKIILNEKEGEIITPHKNFRFFATMNPSEEYAGTKELNKAFLSRFPIVIEIDYSPDEADILKDRTGIESGLAQELVMIAREIRKNKKEEKLTYVCSTRDLIHCASLIKKGIKKELAMQISILNKAPSEERTPLKKLISLMTGDEIKITSDVSYPSIAEMIDDTKEMHKTVKEKNERIKFIEQQYTNLSEQLHKVSTENTKLREQLGGNAHLLSSFRIGDKVKVIIGKHYKFSKEGSEGIIVDTSKSRITAEVKFHKLTGGQGHPTPSIFSIRKEDLQLI